MLLSAQLLLMVAMRRLPHLNGIRAFEVAARCGSFAAAATEMNVTAAAVSRMVQVLEARLGVTLFERKANRLMLTAHGRTYQVGLSPILDALSQVSGLDVTRWIKDDPELRSIPVVAVTAFAMKGDEERIREGGCEAYLSKPISVGKFIETVRRFIG
jgi:CheY-like chemotaxis protein